MSFIYGKRFTYNNSFGAGYLHAYQSARFDLNCTWQGLVERLLEEWYKRTEPQPKSDNLVLISEQIAPPPLQISDTELTSLLAEIDAEGGLANRLASVLRSGNEKAISLIADAIEVAEFRVKRDDLKSGH